MLVRVEGRPVVHDVVHHDGEKAQWVALVGADARRAHDSQREARSGEAAGSATAHQSNRLTVGMEA